jgi:hypothetical protein
MLMMLRRLRKASTGTAHPFGPGRSTPPHLMASPGSLVPSAPEPQNFCRLRKPVPMSCFSFSCVERQRPKLPFDGLEIHRLGLNVGAVRGQ